jgi:hypothetical protein
MAVPIRIINPKTNEPFEFDPLGGITTIEFEHHEVHEGNHFFYTYVDTDWDIVDVVEVLIVVPTDLVPHIEFVINAELDTNVKMYEGATHTPTTELTAYNRNRNSPKKNTTELHNHANDGSDGTLISEWQFGISTGGGSNQIKAGGNTRGDNELILKAGTKYLITITSGTDNSVLSILLDWYETQVIAD